MNILFGFRFLSDYLWNIKIFSITFIAFTGVLCADLYRRFYIDNDGKIPAIFKADIYLFSYFSLTSLSFFLYGGEGALEKYVKLLTVYLAFYIGKVSPPFNIKKIYLFYIPILVFVLFSYLTGSGFQYWGNIQTFSGGYFYKTDLATALTMFTVFLLVSNLNVKIKCALIVVNLFLVFLSNSRMYLFLILIVVPLYFYRYVIFSNAKRVFVVLPIIFILIFIVLYFLNSILQSSGFLLINFDDFFSGENLQGRDLLWENLFLSYFDFSLVNQLFGSGIVKDVDLAYLTGSFESSNSHSTYIYNLISVGVFGSLFFLFFIISTIKQLLLLFEKHSQDENLYNLLYLIAVFVFLFLIAGLSQTVVMYLQLSWFYFFFVGLLYNVNLEKFNKNNI